MHRVYLLILAHQKVLSRKYRAMKMNIKHVQLNIEGEVN